MNDNLDSLSDSELSEVFAVEVAGITPERLAFASRDGGQSGSLYEDFRFVNGPRISRKDVEDFCRKRPEYSVCFHTYVYQQFATSADAVLPWLEKHSDWAINRAPIRDNISVQINLWKEQNTENAFGSAPTLARAACIALIHAARSRKSVSSENTP